MRRIIICILIVGCFRNRTIKIVGLIENHEGTVVALKTNNFTYIDTIVNGNFGFNIKVKRDDYFDLIIIDVLISLYAKPGDRILMDFEKPKEIRFTGVGFEESEYLFQKRNLLINLGISDSRRIDVKLFPSDLDIGAEDFIDKYALAKEIFTEREIFEVIMFGQFTRYLNSQGIEGVDSVIFVFLTTIKDQGRKDFLMAKYNHLKTHKKEKSLLNTEMIDNNVNTVTHLDMAGKIIKRLFVEC